MKSTGLIESWTDTPGDWGPLYPFVGHEMEMLLACAAVCLAFVIWKFRDEQRRYQSEVDGLLSARQAKEEN
jgi:hypothetical protein